MVIEPGWGASQFVILAIAALPYAFATAGQTMAVIIGGIDLSVAAMMTLTSVTAAVLMEGQGEEFGLVAVAAILLMGLGLGAINGLSVVLTRVPDIVVTLAFFFIWEGAALLILDAPGRLGGALAARPHHRPVGGLVVIPDEVSQWLPKALPAPRREPRGRLDPAQALAPRTVDVRRRLATGWRPSAAASPWTGRRVAAYALCGLFAAMGGLVLTMNTGVGTPIQGPYLMASVAAVVLGGVSLAGGRGGLVGPIVAVFILRLARQDLTLLSIDPNVAQVVEGPHHGRPSSSSAPSWRSGADAS